MAFLQTSISESMPIGQVGRRANMEEWNTITRTAETTLIGFAQPVLASGDHGCVLMGEDTLTGAGAAVAGNTGAATITAAPAVADGTETGVYTLTAISAGATAAWLMSDPNGNEMGEVTTGTPATIGGIGPFTITDAGADPAIGDQMTITVSSNAEGFLGLTEADIGLGHATDPDSYHQYDNVAICEKGVIWATAGGTVTRGQPVYWDAATGKYTADTGDVRIPNAEFDSSAVADGLVKIRIRRVPA